MSIFRSEEMTLAQLFLQSEAAYDCVRELGELGKVQFRDLNPEVSAFQRKFINEVRRCDEMERKLRFLSNELEKAEIEPRPAGNIEAPEPQDMIDLEAKFEVLEGEVKEINTNKETLKKNLVDLIELRHILRKTQVFFEEADALLPHQKVSAAEPYTSEEEGKEGKGGHIEGLLESDVEAQAAAVSQTKFTFVTGVIARERMPAFERILWRACRGNVFLRQAEIEEPLEDPTTGNMVNKVVFILFFQGDQLRTRVRKICEGFHATLYQCPETTAERQELMIAVSNRISDLQSVLQTTQDHSITQLQEIAQEIDVWKQKVKKIKAIYDTMNKFNLDVTQRCLIAECWCPIEALEEIQRALTRGTERSGSTVPSILNRMKTNESPPTYFKTNKFTRGFQAIVDAYGIATYEEVNPTLYTIITFPFLFAVMFGDAGHGLLMASFAFALIMFEKRLANSTAGGEMFGTIFHGRYIVFLMGLFSIYTGLIYNDVYSKSLNIFGSSWDPSYTTYLHNATPNSAGGCCPSSNTLGNNTCVITGYESGLTIFPREAMETDQPYPFGIDPIWNMAENKLLYTNSYKMKMSIILGVTQMLFGVLLSIFNHIHFKRYINIFVEFIPQVLFLLCIFGWLVFLVFYKWCRFYPNPNEAPSLLITLIDMFLSFGTTPTGPGDNPDDVSYSVFGNGDAVTLFQRYFQVLLVVVAILCIPAMLAIKPIYLYAKHKRSLKKGDYRRTYGVPETGTRLGEDMEEGQEIIHHEEGEVPVEKDEEEQFDFGETFIHQAIHTIEYCLGTISNTASYLRLWALSLAHAELSEVLWQMVLQRGFGIGIMNPGAGAIALFIMFAFWAVLTIGILLVMEGLSAFLHALRLHWVEFQSKFYEGQGYKFAPFSFETILAGEDEM